MLEQVDVYYNGWGEHWRWGTLVSTTAITGRPLIVFEYSDEARDRGLELSSYTLPLHGPKLRRNFPPHQLALPGPVYDSLPDGWGMLLMDRLFKRRSVNPARIGPLERLAYIQYCSDRNFAAIIRFHLHYGRNRWHEHARRCRLGLM
ncbi:hypothetical protein WJ33_05195 [Burkholderia ubonensis]|uniref:HipA N-terminal subdomain 1 domain-containing protein n=1 Tax=Burkholderia ubonensis TaxID=101571 RepID=A0A103QTT2_9BURK|nr:HipA N-terminal domain-containing protein [Burkholderia ubonensis]KVG55470.1 hypothetical protein WJ33_05195 [Burkholderia ubonensis]